MPKLGAFPQIINSQAYPQSVDSGLELFENTGVFRELVCQVFRDYNIARANTLKLYSGERMNDGMTPNWMTSKTFSFDRILIRAVVKTLNQRRGRRQRVHRLVKPSWGELSKAMKKKIEVANAAGEAGYQGGAGLAAARPGLSEVAAACMDSAEHLTVLLPDKLMSFGEPGHVDTR